MVLIIKTKWNQEIVGSLAEAAATELKNAGIKSEIIEVNGALEIPLAIKWAWANAQRKQTALDGIIACGCVIKGETYHFEVVANESSRAVTELSVQLNLPIANAILTVYDKEQAIARTKGDKNKGVDAAYAILGMLNLKKEKEFI